MRKEDIESILDKVFNKSVDILGQKYEIQIRNPDQDRSLKKPMTITHGYMNASSKRIVLANRAKTEMTVEMFGDYIENMKRTLRHEIVHAFLYESGLANNARVSGSWPTNEEMVDWIAIQGPKLTAAWISSGSMTPPIYTECGEGADESIVLYSEGREICRIPAEKEEEPRTGNITVNGNGDCMTAQEETWLEPERVKLG